MNPVAIADPACMRVGAVEMCASSGDQSRAASIAGRLLLRGRSSADAGVQARRRRVTLLVIAMILMGLSDLIFTLIYMTSVGMVELNPLARVMVAIGGVGQLVRFKLFTMALSAGLLYLLRSHRIAERCAWISCVALLALCLRWVRYNESITEAPSVGPQIASMDPAWVAILD